MILAELVDTNALLKVILYSLVSAVGVTAVLSFAIVGLARFDDRRRTGSGGTAWLVLALVCALIIAAVVVEAIVVMAKK